MRLAPRHKLILVVLLGVAGVFAAGVAWSYYDIHIRAKPIVFTEAERAALHADTLASVAAYNAGEFRRAYDLWLARAEAGDAEAQFRVGRLFSKGRGAGQDYQQAYYWYQKAAQQQHLGGISGVGYLYDTGKGVAQNLATGRKFYLKAANLGYAIAQYNLGIIYKKGDGVPVDYVKARNWLEKAAAGGDCVAFASLGGIYKFGEGVKKNHLMAYRYFKEAEHRGCDFWWSRWHLWWELPPEETKRIDDLVLNSFGETE